MSKKGEIAPHEVACAVCPEVFVTTHSQGKYCSDRCRHEGAKSSCRAWGDRNREHRRRFGRAYYAANRDRELESKRAYQKTEAGRAAARRSYANQLEKHPERIFARQVVLAALRARLLKKESCRCGAQKVHAHHHDYSKPLEVEWLCPPCHRTEHAQQRS